MTIPLSRSEFAAIIEAAACLYPGDRPAFIAAVVAALNGLPVLGDGAVGRVIREVQPRFSHPEPEPMPARWERDKPRFEHVSKR